MSKKVRQKFPCQHSFDHLSPCLQVAATSLSDFDLQLDFEIFFMGLVNFLLTLVRLTGIITHPFSLLMT